MPVDAVGRWYAANSCAVSEMELSAPDYVRDAMYIAPMAVVDSDAMSDRLFDRNGNMVGYVTSMQLDRSISSSCFGASTPRVTGTFELIDPAEFLTKENTMNPGLNAPAPVISERLISVVGHSPQSVVDELQALLDRAHENIEKKEREERKKKKRAKRQRRARKLAELRRENALAVLEEGTHKKIETARITAATALLDRLG